MSFWYHIKSVGSGSLNVDLQERQPTLKLPTESLTVGHCLPCTTSTDAIFANRLLTLPTNTLTIGYKPACISKKQLLAGVLRKWQDSRRKTLSVQAGRKAQRNAGYGNRKMYQMVK